jgi:hypothetical protein
MLNLNKIKSGKIIYIPIGIKSILNILNKSQLTKIHNNPVIAYELVLMFLSNFASVAFYNTSNTWKQLNSKMLEKQLGRTSVCKSVRMEIINLLTDLKLLEVDKSYMVDKYSRKYRLIGKLKGRNFKRYELREERCITLSQNLQYYKLKLFEDNDIVYGLLNSYENVVLPSEEELLKYLKNISKLDKQNKLPTDIKKLLKNKKLYNKPTRKVTKREKKQIVYISDLMATFKYLTTDGFIMPTPSKSNGGRVVDSFTLMPRIIRNLIKFKQCVNSDKPTYLDDTVEIDYKCLHPNICKYIYDTTSIKDTTEAIDHNKIAKVLNISRNKAKVENLSFFNKQVSQMVHSPLFKYYKEHEPTLLSTLLLDKNMNGYKSTYYRLVTKEVDIITDVIKLLNRQNIKFLYIYDALRVNVKDKNKVKAIMNYISNYHSVLTTAV